MKHKELFAELQEDALFAAAESMQAGVVGFGSEETVHEDTRELVAVR